jgi:hypothetical protein
MASPQAQISGRKATFCERESTRLRPSSGAHGANDFLLMKFSRPFRSFVDVWSSSCCEFLFIRATSLIRG